MRQLATAGLGTVFNDASCLSQEGGAKTNADIFWTLSCGFLVFFMQAGFAMLEAGQVRMKNRSNMLLKNLMDASFGGLVWYLLGYAFAFGDAGGSFIGAGWGYMTDPCSDNADIFLQWTFAVTSATIVSGAVAERCQFSAYLLLTVIIQGWVYPVAAHWGWSHQGWLGGELLGDYRYLDFAGSGVVHLTGGTAALLGAYLIGPRRGRFNRDTVWELKGNSSALSAVGTFCLWFSWYGFNAVNTGTFELMHTAARVAMCTTLSACASTCVCFLLPVIHSGMPDIQASLNGILGGLVSITASCAFVTPWMSIIIGAMGGVLTYYLSAALVVLKIDDPVNATPVHFGCGTWGVVSVGLFASPAYIPDAPGQAYGVVYGGNPKQLGVQLLGAVAIILWTGVTIGPLLLLLNKLGRLRVTYELELCGLDKMIHDSNAPPSRHAPSNHDDRCVYEGTVQEFVPDEYPLPQRIIKYSDRTTLSCSGNSREYEDGRLQRSNGHHEPDVVM